MSVTSHPIKRTIENQNNLRWWLAETQMINQYYCWRKFCTKFQNFCNMKIKSLEISSCDANPYSLLKKTNVALQDSKVLLILFWLLRWKDVWTVSTLKHMKPTGTPSSPALENNAFPTLFVICTDHQVS